MTYRANIHARLPVEDLDTDSLPAERREPDDWLQSTSGAASLLCAFAEIMNDGLGLDAALDLALENTMALADMDAAAVLLFDPLTHELSPKTYSEGPPKLVRTSDRVQTHEGLMSRMLTTVLATNDITRVTEMRHLALEREGLRSLLSIPLLSSGHLQGVMILASHRERMFLSEEMELFAIMGRHIGSAIYRANLRSQELRAAVLEERRAMAREMHDDIAQTLGYLGLQIDNVIDHPSLAQNRQVQAELEQIRTAIDSAYQRVRMSITRLSKDIPEQFDLKAALQEIIAEFTDLTECRVKTEVNVDCLMPLSPTVAVQASRIIQEALSNTRKHAGANTVRLILQELSGEMIEIIVEDNGQGFDVDAASHANEYGFGLRFMKERAQRVGGALRVESVHGQGTRIVVHLPLKGEGRT